VQDAGWPNGVQPWDVRRGARGSGLGAQGYLYQVICHVLTTSLNFYFPLLHNFKPYCFFDTQSLIHFSKLISINIHPNGLSIQYSRSRLDNCIAVERCRPHQPPSTRLEVGPRFYFHEHNIQTTCDVSTSNAVHTI
jgi:hypothetical protein